MTGKSETENSFSINDSSDDDEACRKNRLSRFKLDITTSEMTILFEPKKQLEKCHSHSNCNDCNITKHKHKNKNKNNSNHAENKVNMNNNSNNNHNFETFSSSQGLTNEITRRFKVLNNLFSNQLNKCNKYRSTINNHMKQIEKVQTYINDLHKQLKQCDNDVSKHLKRCQKLHTDNVQPVDKQWQGN